MWTPRQAKRLATTWSRLSTLLCFQACKGDPTTTPLLVTHPTPWLPCCYPASQPDPHLAHDPTPPQAEAVLWWYTSLRESVMTSELLLHLWRKAVGGGARVNVSLPFQPVFARRDVEEAVKGEF